MTSLLDGLIDPRLIPAVTWLIIGVIALIVVYTAFRIVRMLTSGTYIAGGRNRRTRLAVLDAAAVDDRRRLVLVRRDDVEHLILIGGPTDVVVEQDIRIGARPSRAAAAEPDHALDAYALDAYDHGDDALQPQPVLPTPPRQPNRAPERQPAQRAAAPARPAHVEPAPVTPEPQPVAARPVAPMALRQPVAQVVQQAPVPAAQQPRAIRPVMPRVTLPAATQPNFVQPVEEHRDPPITARVTAHPARAQANRRAQQQQPQPAPVPVENDLDDALLQELETSLRYPARERTRTKAADIDDEMNKLLGEMSRDRR